MCSPQPSEPALIQHKRESFDGMRAYHTSEINHKQHTIDILKTVIVPVIAFYGGLITYSVSNHPKLWPVVAIGVGVVAFVWWFTDSLVTETCKKIDRDHLVYNKHRADYVDALGKLNLMSTHWDLLTEKEDGETGYAFTKKIIREFRWLIVGLAITGSILSCLVAY